MLIDLSTIDGVFLLVDGIPRPQWEVITQWIEGNAPVDQLNPVWTDVAGQWLARIQATWGGGYRCYTSPNFLLLTADRESASGLLSFCETTLVRIKAALIGAVADEGFGPHVLIECAQPQHYYDYVCYFYDEGQWATSGGMFLDDIYGHIVLAPAATQRKETVAHELTHNLLRHLPLPRWLNEGLAVTMEGIVLGRNPGWPTLEGVHRLREFWPQRGIDAFWCGDSFYDVDEDGQYLSYLLARCLVRRLADDYPKVFHAFVREAVWNDAGEAAARTHFRLGLGDLLTQFLGDGDWNPRPFTE